MRLAHLAYGGDYNPEQWPEEVWREDVRLMREAGVNLVTLGVFAWSRLEPEPGGFDFGWLDRVIDLLHAGGVAVDLATATASPPPWLAHRHPESLPVLADGTRLWPGGRQQYCPSSPAYREAARRLVQALAGRYGRHPAVVLWHVNNEYGCHVPACWCDESAAAFRAWLRRRYGTLDALNEAWGTAFWSQRYSAWEEVLPPRRAPALGNPTQQLDFRRFSSDALLECFDMERAVLAERSPDVPVTTNFMGFFEPLDYWRWAAREDVVSNDAYPDPSDPRAHVRAAMSADLVRSLGGGRPWLLMEQTTHRVNWRARNVPKAPGQMRLWSYQAIARGADGVLFFQWRQSRAGAEKFHSAMVPHGPVESSPTWHEVTALGAELRRLDEVTGTRVPASTAIVLDWESWWALELPSKPSADVRLLDQVEAYYGPLHRASVTADFASPAADLSGYRLVLVPNLYLAGDEAAANLRAFVERGGTLVMGFFSGIVDPSDHVHPGGYPGAFADLLGLTVEDFAPLAAGEELGLRFGEGAGGPDGLARTWSELITPHGAEVVGSFAGGALDGRPAVLRHGFGAGAAWYVGTVPDAATLERILRRAWTEAGVAPVAPSLPEGVEAVRRVAPAGELLFLLNHRPDEVEAPVPAGGLELLSGRRVPDGRLRLAGRGVAIVR
ncbi:MAG TPA: beta-galactosidase [Candidatus Eisenbacteria bacterium]|nr:beta-galactosidase [Candidatus Eisenbacteria bacterium]